MTPLAGPAEIGERGRLVLLALLLFINALILDANEVVATSGFIRNVGASNILWVWAADMLIVVLASGVYSLVIDRAQRGRLAVRLFAGFSLVYVALYALFALGAPDWLSYSLLTIINDQQWLLFPLLIWALANDMFLTAEAKRFFPRLGIAALLGGLLGNGLAVAAANVLGRNSVALLLANAAMIMLVAIILAAALRRIRVEAHSSRQGDKMLDNLREGLAFVREVPAYRYLTLAMILLGVGLNALEFQFITQVSRTFTELPALQSFYGLVKIASALLLLVVQGFIATWLLARLGFKSIFGMMPGVLLTGLVLTLALPGLAVVAVGHSLARVTLLGIDEPSRRAFQGLVPDERRGRVSVFMDGYLYPTGIILSCAMIGATLFAVGRGLLPLRAAELTYLGVGVVCVIAAAWAIFRFRKSYDGSMLNWRLRRRQRKGTGVLSRLEF